MNDFLIDDNTDLQIANGDLVVGLSDEQHQELLLICEKGSFKENVMVGVGATNYIEDEDQSNLLTEIRRQFLADGMMIKTLSVSNNKLIIDAGY